MTIGLAIVLGLLALSSFALAPRLREANVLFCGWSEHVSPPGLLTLVLSQVTTWIFAWSLLTAAILGFYYGIAGALAYAAYYLSFSPARRLSITFGFAMAKTRSRISCVAGSATAACVATIS
ncbi:MAG: hypothetical protein VX741_05035 [Pseudomonadota bacterium]|nr:hypothetical protein [Pseudomonadota bacterium]